MAEFRAMPTSCLERRMFSTLDRYGHKIAINAPGVTLEQWNERRRVEEAKWKEFDAKCKAEESSPLKLPIGAILSVEPAAGAGLDAISQFYGVTRDE